MKISLKTTGIVALLTAMPLVGALQGCSDLTETPTSTISPTNYYRTEAEVLGGLAGVYAVLRQSEEGYWFISQVPTDETVVPIRGGDWLDGGKWIELHKQTWTAGSAAAQGDINGSWNGIFTGVSRANVLLGALKPNSIRNQAIIEAEAHALRAFYYYELMDLFGNVPIVEDIDVKPRKNSTRAEVFAFVEKELLAARSALPLKWDAANYGRLTQGAADAILASLYLNAEVFSGTVTASGLTKGPARWQDAVTAADRILNSGQYSLASDWRSIFSPKNESSPELIMVNRNSPQPDLGLTFINRALHYNSYKSPGGWNGFSTLAETYNAFDNADLRKQIFLIGPQFSVETPDLPINDRKGARLNFTLTIGDITQAAENEGARVYKYTFDPAHSQQQMGNDYAIFRLAEIYLIKAEALNELGRTGEAVALVNIVRARVFNPPQPLSAGLSQSSFRTAVLKERLLELNNEGKRRQDMIRFGVFTSPNSYKAAQTEPFRILFPIPVIQLQTNPLLVQNPGY
ncbi:MAG: RagB/SusD family nutrient uptake outer membrane protein [Gemmatimonadaceae bacterium]